MRLRTVRRVVWLVLHRGAACAGPGALRPKDIKRLAKELGEPISRAELKA
eukprot:SAG11_NODE_7378_length_1153_cov_0.880455_1_plen_49_part_10